MDSQSNHSDFVVSGLPPSNACLQSELENQLGMFQELSYAYFAVPRYLEFMAELPATENGKIQKFKLRERGVTPATWDREAAGIKVMR